MPHQNTNARRGTNSEDIVDTELVFWMRRARRKKRGMGKLCKSVRVSGQLERPPIRGARSCPAPNRNETALLPECPYCGPRFFDSFDSHCDFRAAMLG